MDLRVLNYFLAVSEEKTITKAAELLHISQPALSKQLKDLEEELGITLFIRGNKHIVLTEEGEYLKKQSKTILSLVKNTKHHLMQNNIIEGEISIGCGETRAFNFIGSIMNDLLNQHPGIKLKLFSGNADSIIEKLDKNSIDFGLVIDPVAKNMYEHIRLPISDRWGILVDISHPLSTCQNITPSDLTNYPLLISNQSLVNNQLTEWFGKNLSHLTILGTYNLLYNASMLAQNKKIVVLCIDGIINTTDSKLVFIPLSPQLEVHTNIIWRNRQAFSSASSLFLQTIQTKLLNIKKIQ